MQVVYLGRSSRRTNPPPQLDGDVIELLSNNWDDFGHKTSFLPDDAGLIPIAVEEDVVSLSAILLDEGYYDALQAAKRQMDGVTVIDETLLIPFKARAFLDLTARAEAGEKIDAKNIKKHRNDVFRLAQLLPKDASIVMADPIREDLRKFLDLAAADATLDPKAFDVQLTRDEAIALLRSAYGVA